MLMTEGAAAMALALAMLVTAPVEAKRDIVAGAVAIAEPAPAGRWEALQPTPRDTPPSAAPAIEPAAPPAAWRISAHNLCRTASHARSPLCATPD